MTSSPHEFTTNEVLALRKLGESPDRRFIDWAIQSLIEGQDSPALRILAGETPPLWPTEMEALIDRTFRELGLQVPETEEEAHLVLAQRLARLVVDGRLDRGAALSELKDSYYSSGYLKELESFQMLHDARVSLQSDIEQWYWAGADRSNIDQLIDQQFRAFLDGKTLVPPEPYAPIGTPSRLSGEKRLALTLLIALPVIWHGVTLVRFAVMAPAVGESVDVVVERLGAPEKTEQGSWRWQWRHPSWYFHSLTVWDAEVEDGHITELTAISR